MIHLRDYQQRDAERLRDSFRRGKKAPLYVAPCGSGKTVLFSYVCDEANARGNKVLVLCHRTELIDQISTSLTDRGVQHGIIAAGYPFKRDESVYVASVFTLVRRLDCFTPDLVVIDEAHHTSEATTWGQVLKAYPKSRRLGVTATPVRTSGEGMEAFFDDIIIGPTYEELTNDGYLTPLRAYSPPTVQTQGMHVRAGEFVPAESVSRSDRPSVTGDAIEHYRRLTPGRRAIVFDVSVEAARKRAEAFRAAGFQAESIDGSLDRQVRAMAVADFRAGRIQVLTSCDLVSEGFDLPAIEVGISLRPTQSLTVWMQQSGRILRPMEGKSEAVLFDHTGNIERHGLPTEQRDWTLSGVAAPANGAKPQSSVRVCLSCFAVNPPGVKVCKACGVAFKVEGRKVAYKEGELREVTQEQLRARFEQRAKRANQWAAQSIEALIELGRMRGMRNPEGWAKHVIDARRAKGRG